MHKIFRVRENIAPLNDTYRRFAQLKRHRLKVKVRRSQYPSLSLAHTYQQKIAEKSNFVEMFPVVWTTGDAIFRSKTSRSRSHARSTYGFPSLQSAVTSRFTS